MVPLNSCWRKRPSSTIFMSAEPAASVGGLPGSIHSLVWVVQLPARLANNLCGSPGVASFLYNSIIACGSICFSGLLSLAIATATVRTTQRPVRVRYVRRMVASFLIEMGAGCLWHDHFLFSHLLEIFMHELDGHGALADGRSDALDRIGSNVPCREDACTAGLQQEWLPG